MFVAAVRRNRPWLWVCYALTMMLSILVSVYLVLLVPVYAAMLARATADLAAGAATVVLDGSYARREDREGVRRMAAATGARCVFVWCLCSDEEVGRRLALRRRDPGAVSDGRWEIYLHQLQTFARPHPDQEADCLAFNTERAVGELLAELERKLAG